MVKKLFVKKVEESEEEDDVIEEQSEESVKLEKPKRKTNYVLTDARKKAFEKAREVREANVKKKKEIKDLELQSVKN